MLFPFNSSGCISRANETILQTRILLLNDLKFESEIEYENEFLILICRFHIVTLCTHLELSSLFLLLNDLRFESEIEYENDFIILICRFHIVTLCTHLELSSLS